MRILFFQNHVELVDFAGAVGELLCCGRYSEQGRVCFYAHGLAVGLELEDSQPPVAAVAFPAAAKSLHVEHHLRHGYSGVVLVLTE